MQNVAHPSFPLLCPGGRDLERLESCPCPPLRDAGCAGESFLNAIAVAELMQNDVFTLPFPCPCHSGSVLPPALVLLHHPPSPALRAGEAADLAVL